MSTIKVYEDVTRELFEVAAELQLKLGRKVPLSEAIKTPLEVYRSGERDKSKILSLYGSVGKASEARRFLRELRAEEDVAL